MKYILLTFIILFATSAHTQTAECLEAQEAAQDVFDAYDEAVKPYGGVSNFPLERKTVWVRRIERAVEKVEEDCEVPARTQTLPYESDECLNAIQHMQTAEGEAEVDEAGMAMTEACGGLLDGLHLVRIIGREHTW